TQSMDWGGYYYVQQLSLDAWIDPTTLSPAGSAQTIVSKFDAYQLDPSQSFPKGSGFLLQELDGGKLLFAVYQQADGSVRRAVVTDDPIITTDDWQHVAGVFDGATGAMTIYVNGTPVASHVTSDSTAIDHIGPTSSPIRIGKAGDGSNSFHGLIDEVGYFQSALTSAQVARIYAQAGGGQGDGNTIQGNFVGVGANGEHLGNPGDGIRIDYYSIPWVGLSSAPTGTLVGGREVGAGNTIAYNGGAGVSVVATPGYSNGTGNAILGNSIHDNGRPGIDLAGGMEDSFGNTLNHAGFSIGPNYYQNKPVIDAAYVGSGITTITGVLDSSPDSTFELEFFSNDHAGPAGQNLLGRATVHTDAAGHSAFAVQLSTTPPAGQTWLTATATSSSGDTSEFSSATAVVVSAGTNSIRGVKFNDLNGNGVRDLETTTSAPFVVPGYADPWLAGMPAGATASGYPPAPSAGHDIAPAQSPVLVPLAVTPNGDLSFDVSGSVDHCGSGCNPGTPDGAGLSPHYAGAENGISDYYAPVDALVGVFLGPDDPTQSAAPNRLDFSTPDSRDYSTLSPALKQVFFIGD
ncbi:MAG TPA: LamG domain-containing protein, partial [Pirellulaceae bacterium]|nr:LamG domain-containing protein [Pirellulaceae bacterium]